MKILLNDILRIPVTDLENTKIRFNQSTRDGDYNPVKFFKEKNERLYEGQFWNYKRKSYKPGQIAIGFIRLNDDKWLLFDVSRITKDLDVYNAIGYEYEKLQEYEKYFGRLIIRYKNTSQNLIRNARSVMDDCEIFEIIDDTFDDDGFPGYENVDLSWHDLKRVIDKKDWKTALENQKGVYLITDVNNGRRYVGSAYGEKMLLGRLTNYAKTGHGSNKDLKKLQFKYIKNNFRYSILEIYKSTVDDKIIINREHYWMRILLSKNKKHGYNN